MNNITIYNPDIESIKNGSKNQYALLYLQGVDSDSGMVKFVRSFLPINDKIDFIKLDKEVKEKTARGIIILQSPNSSKSRKIIEPACFSEEDTSLQYSLAQAFGADYFWYVAMPLEGPSSLRCVNMMNKRVFYYELGHKAIQVNDAVMLLPLPHPIRPFRTQGEECYIIHQ